MNRREAVTRFACYGLPKGLKEAWIETDLDQGNIPTFLIFLPISFRRFSRATRSSRPTPCRRMLGDG